MKRTDLPRRIFPILLACMLGVLSACGTLLPGQGPAPRLYQLTPKTTFPDNLPQVGWQLVLEVPFAPAALDSTRIGVMPSTTGFEYYARANWTDRAALMIQTLMTESFDSTGKIVAVGRESVGLRADFLLKTELREFQAEAFHDPAIHRVRVRINARLVRMPERMIVASRDFERTVDAPPDSMEGIIHAFDDALGRVLKELVQWTLVTGEQSATKTPISAP